MQYEEWAIVRGCINRGSPAHSTYTLWKKVAILKTEMLASITQINDRRTMRTRDGERSVAVSFWCLQLKLLRGTGTDYPINPRSPISSE